MSLSGWQRTLGLLVGAHPAKRPALVASIRRGHLADLDAEESAYLAAIADTRGLRFTADVQRSWCALRATRAAHFTLGVLPMDHRRRLVESWLDRGGGRASFFATEAEAFLEFIAAALPARSHALSVCRFEQAAHRAASASSVFVARDGGLRPDIALRRGAGSAVVDFHAEPARVLAALSTSAPAPAVRRRTYPVLFAPGMPRLWRACSRKDVAIWTRCGRSSATTSALVASGVRPELVRALWREGALDAVDA